MEHVQEIPAPEFPAPEITGVVLAGGASRRMGRDKALLVSDDPAAGGRTFLELAAEKLAAVCGEVIVADRGRGLPSRPGGIGGGLLSVDDGPGRGPAAGILGAAAARPGRSLLVLACDLPGVPVELLAFLARQEGDWVIPAPSSRPSPAGGDSVYGLQPTCALYRPPALEALAGLVASGRYGPRRLLDVPDLAVRRLGPAELAAYGPAEAVFHNVNTPQDLREGPLARIGLSTGVREG